MRYYGSLDDSTDQCKLIYVSFALWEQWTQFSVSFLIPVTLARKVSRFIPVQTFFFDYIELLHSAKTSEKPTWLKLVSNPRVHEM